MTEQIMLSMSVFNALSDAIAIVDQRTGDVRLNQRFVQVLGTGEHIRQALAPVWNAGSVSWTGLFPLSDGHQGNITFALHAVTDADGQVVQRVAIAKDLPQTAHKDPLTHLPERPFLVDRLEHAAQTQKRHGGTVALMVLGLDHFTLVNEAHGLAAGDMLLAQTANRLRTCIRESDSAFRLDGDKFGILLAVTEPDDTITVADKILAAMRHPYTVLDQEVTITTSIGIASYPGDNDDVSQMITIAENSLHHAKEAGRNQYQFFSKDMNGKALNRFNLVSRLRRGISNDEFVVYYQPKVRSDDNSIIGAEALARWNDPELGLLPPVEFIPVAEETGLIEEIGQHILTMCCRQGRKWQDAGFDPIILSCNLSPRQFRNTNIVHTIEQILVKTGLPATWLDLEITEAAIMSDLDNAAQKMTALRNLGIGLSVSEFGSETSSLSNLGRIPATSVKIDKAFVSDVDSNPKSAEIARAIIGLSKGLNMNVVAEGCEIPEHLKFLKEHGCDAVQGYYFSKAVPAHEFEAMLRAGMVYPVPSVAGL